MVHRLMNLPSFGWVSKGIESPFASGLVPSLFRRLHLHRLEQIRDF